MIVLLSGDWSRPELHVQLLDSNLFLLLSRSLSLCLSLALSLSVSVSLSLSLSLQVVLKGESTSQVVQDDQVKGALRVRH